MNETTTFVTPGQHLPSYDQVIEVSPNLAERAPDAALRLSAAAEAWARDA